MSATSCTCRRGLASSQWWGLSRSSEGSSAPPRSILKFAKVWRQQAKGRTLHHHLWEHWGVDPPAARLPTFTAVWWSSFPVFLLGTGVDAPGIVPSTDVYL
ncbi:uncharacterized protein Tco025E_03582 [Trypanosoma conorhini]|uniref:Uncharacterized protein n=1 Tax=Trypanosoma conorhini TaxID=83891 RepID=A0A3R7NE53_9TRYP|nr:uncharacterized protein Tco025E_03582 [Trypanosoma conorhini]RNF20852.1 hypothetical protein Tco025E_03582 [Trypanosoma conorhini]